MHFTLNQLAPSEFLSQSKKGVIVDVRTPSEYRKGHIPGSVNIPLFNDEERVWVGTTYKQTGKEEAIELGLSLVGPKIRQIVTDAKLIANGLPLFIYCWRGGMRSGSVGWLLQTAGLKVSLLKGGYKNYRKHFVSLLNGHMWKFISVGGRTGSGKTDILHQLIEMGEQVIDLEALAHHKGSAFGSLGQPPQPSNEHFENLLHHALNELNPANVIWIEAESHTIGINYIPDPFFEFMQQCVFVNVIVPRKNRISRLVKDYAVFPKEELVNSVLKIKKKLGGLVTQQCLTAIEQNEFAQVASMLLNYYDKTYDFGFKERETTRIVIEFDHDDPALIASSLVHDVKPQCDYNGCS